MPYPPDYMRQASFRQAENAGQAIDTAKLDAELNSLSAISAQVNRFLKLLAKPNGEAVEQFTQLFQAFAGVERIVALAGQTVFSTNIPFVPMMNGRTLFGWVNGVLVDTNLVTVAAYTNGAGIQACRVTIPATTVGQVVVFSAFDSDAAIRSDRIVAVNAQTVFVATSITYAPTMTTSNTEVYITGVRQDPTGYTVTNDISGKVRVILTVGVTGTPVVIIVVKDSATSIFSRLLDSSSVANGANLVGVTDVLGIFGASTVEGALAEIRVALNALLTTLGTTANIWTRGGLALGGGQASAAFQMGAQKISNMADGSLAQDAVTVKQLSDNVKALTDLLGLFLRTDGSSTMSGDLDLGGFNIVNGGNTQLPVGVVLWFPGAGLPAAIGNEQWAACSGAALSRAAYPALFAIIGITYGPGDGVTTFNLPDARGRTMVHVGTGPGGQVWNLNTKIGTETHTLLTTETPAHTHTTTTATQPGSGGGYGLDGGYDFLTVQTPAAVTGSTGGGLPHANIQPSFGLNLVIKIRN